MRSLTTKLTIAFLFVGLAGIVLAAIIIRQQTRTAFDQFLLNRDQQALVNGLQQYYRNHGSWLGIENNLQPLAEALRRETNDNGDLRLNWMRFALVDVEQKVVFSLLPGQTGRRVPDSELRRGIPLVVGDETTGWLLISPLPRQWIPNSPEALFLRSVNRAILFSALVATLLALTLGGVLAFTLTRSLRELTEATVEIARGKLGRQVKVRSADELGELATSFNKMSLDLAQATQARRQMTADIAHDLRSPLSVISGYAEALTDGKLSGTPEVYEVLHQETKQLSRLVEDLRTLSLADAGELSLNLQPVDPRLLLGREAARHAVAAGQKNIALRVEAEAGLPSVNVDAERIAQVLDNLLANALRYTPEGGEIVLAARPAGGRVQLQVRDSGAGIATDDLPHIFDRFYRGDKARQQNGESGLGLAIARSIVAAHGGTLSVDSVPGEGATFTITLG